MPLPPQSSLQVSGDFIVYRESDGAEVWRLLIGDVILIGEYTTSAGPDDDYFLEFGHICEGEPCFTGCPVPGGAEAFLEELGTVLGARLRLKLVAVTTFASRVLWPERLAGKPVFVLRETAQHVGLARLKRRLFGGETEWIVSAEVDQAMRAECGG